MILRFRTSARGASLLLFLAAIAAAGCGLFDPPQDKPKPIEPPSRTTREGMLQYFAFVQESSSRNIEDYGRCLHSLYQFYFTAEDRAGDPTLPEYWFKSEDVTATTNMFGAAITISMDVTVTDTITTDSLTLEPCFEAPDTAHCYLYECLIDLAVEVPEEPENRTFLVHGFADIAVTRDEFEGDSLWVIASIRDRTSVISRQAASGPRDQLAEPAPGSPLAGAQVVSWGELREILSNHTP